MLLWEVLKNVGFREKKMIYYLADGHLCEYYLSGCALTLTIFIIVFLYFHWCLSLSLAY